MNSEMLAPRSEKDLCHVTFVTETSTGDLLPQMAEVNQSSGDVDRNRMRHLAQA
jgi:hypothetical protein